MSGFDDKRFVLQDGIHTLAYFHKDLKEQKDAQKYFHKKGRHLKRFSQIGRYFGRWNKVHMGKNKCTQIKIDFDRWEYCILMIISKFWWRNR